MPGGWTAGGTPHRTRGADGDAGPLDRRYFEATRPARDYAGPLVLAGPRSRGRNLLSGMRPTASERREVEEDGESSGHRRRRVHRQPPHGRTRNGGHDVDGVDNLRPQVHKARPDYGFRTCRESIEISDSQYM